VEAPPAVLAPQATALVNPRVLVEVVAVGAHRPEARQSQPLILRALSILLAPFLALVLAPADRQFRLLRGEIDLGEEAELVVIEGLLGAVVEDGPGVGDELEGLIREGELVLVRVEEQREAAILLLDEVLVFGTAIKLEDRVPIVVIVYALLRREEDVRYGQDLVRAFQKGLRLLGEDGEVSRSG
jgi:hypothetical protein